MGKWNFFREKVGHFLHSNKKTTHNEVGEFTCLQIVINKYVHRLLCHEKKINHFGQWKNKIRINYRDISYTWHEAVSPLCPGLSGIEVGMVPWRRSRRRRGQGEAAVAWSLSSCSHHCSLICSFAHAHPFGEQDINFCWN